MSKPKLITSFSESNLEEILSRLLLNKEIDKELYENLDNVVHCTTKTRDELLVAFNGFPNGTRIFNTDLKIYQEWKNFEWVKSDKQ